MKRRGILAAIFAQPLLTLVLSAQPVYRLGPDTLRYRHETDFRIAVRAGDSLAVGDAKVDAEIAVVLQPQASGWYERLAMKMTRDGVTTREPVTDPVVGKRFSFAFARNGRTAAHHSPEVPEDILLLYDVTFQFDDFFISLPAQPLAPGVTWADTLVITRTGHPAIRMHSTIRRQFRVERETSAGVERAVVISVRSSGKISSSLSLGRGVSPLEASYEAEEKGEVTVTLDGSQMLRRETEGTAQGRMVARRGARSLTLPMGMGYRHTIELNRRQP